MKWQQMIGVSLLVQNKEKEEHLLDFVPESEKPGNSSHHIPSPFREIFPVFHDGGVASFDLVFVWVGLSLTSWNRKSILSFTVFEDTEEAFDFNSYIDETTKKPKVPVLPPLPQPMIGLLPKKVSFWIFLGSCLGYLWHSRSSLCTIYTAYKMETTKNWRNTCRGSRGRRWYHYIGISQKDTCWNPP